MLNSLFLMDKVKDANHRGISFVVLKDNHVFCKNIYPFTGIADARIAAVCTKRYQYSSK